MTKTFYLYTYLLIILLSLGLPALAKWGTFTMTDDNGDQVIVKHGLFGKKTIVKDRYGDGFANSKSIFGLTKDTQVGVLGNEVHAHKGLFGFGKTEGHDVLGDTVSSKNNPLYRNTNVNLSGANSFLNKFFAPKPSSPVNPTNMPGQVGSMPNMQPGIQPVNTPAPLIDPNAFSGAPTPINPNSSN